MYIVEIAYADFKSDSGEHCEKQYGFFRPVVDEVVEEYLRCGDLHEGFARVRCPILNATMDLPRS
jgi:hypothetical protein